MILIIETGNKNALLYLKKNIITKGIVSINHSLHHLLSIDVH